MGQRVSIPGEEITDAVKRFWRNGLFSNVSIEADSVVGDKVYGPDPEIFLRFREDALTAADRQALRLSNQALRAVALEVLGRSFRTVRPPWRAQDGRDFRAHG